MATMWPRELPEATKRDPLRRAEKVVFEHFRDNLPQDFHVFWSRSWINPKRTEGKQEGECDFIVLHPDLGFCVLEVKGGSVKNDPKTNEWTSTGSSGVVHEIQDPFNQASTSKHILLEHFKELFARKGVTHFLWIPCYHGVVFPDVERKNVHSLAPKAPPHLICYSEDLDEKLEGWVANLMSGENKDPQGFRLQVFPLLKSYLEERLSFPMSLKAILQDEELLMESLTDQQALVLEAFKAQPRIRVMGGAGTGKTVLALKESLRLSEEGFRTALVCYNRGLARHLESQVPESRKNENLQISTLYSLLWQGTKVPNWILQYHRHLMQGGDPMVAAPAYLRRLTLEESAALQTFPRNATWHGGSSAVFRQIGNAVPPNLAYHVALAVKASLAVN